jgi:S1-C subfamily serine protease
MKDKFLVAVVLFFSSLAFGQEQDKIYYNSEGKGLPDVNGAGYYRTVFFDSLRNMVDSVHDYYIGGGIRLKGVALKIDNDDKETVWIGRRLTYYKSGELMSDDFYNKIGKLDSVNRSYFESGKTKREAVFKNGAVVDKFYKEWDEFDHCEKVFIDAFHYDNNKNNWPLSSNDKVDSKIIKDEGLEMTSFGVNEFKQTLDLPLDPNNNYSIETVVDIESGDPSFWHGLVWGFKDWDNYFFFYINANGHYTVGNVFEGIRNFYVRNGQSQDIKPGNCVNNLIKIIMLKGKMYYSVNGVVLYQMQAYNFSSNQIGFYISSGKQQVLFRSIMVRQKIDENNNNGPGSLAGSGAGNSEFKGWKGNGSGFFIDTRGYIVTNYHVIANANEIEVDATQNGERNFFKAVVVSSDKQNDLALLKITDDKFMPYTSLPYNFKTDAVDVATDVFTLGFPAASVMGTEVKFTDGKISSKTGFNGSPETYQISVPIQPGNSGGPLFDNNGNIVGIVNSKIENVMVSNVAYAIKSGYLKNFLDAVLEKLTLPHDPSLAHKALTEKIKILTDYVVLVKVK